MPDHYCPLCLRGQQNDKLCPACRAWKKLYGRVSRHLADFHQPLSPELLKARRVRIRRYQRRAARQKPLFDLKEA